jgi:site-specific DNA-methyltransferase (adenine-specific)
MDWVWGIYHIHIWGRLEVYVAVCFTNVLYSIYLSKILLLVGLMLEINQVYQMDCVEGMRKLDEESVDLVVTSPPYGNLRTYNGFSFNVVDVCLALYRVLKPGGVVVWVVGDETIRSESGASFEQALCFRDNGFRIHDTMIYLKSGFSNPAKTRYHQVFEYMFVFSKGKPKTFNPLKDRPNKNRSSWGNTSLRQKDGTLKNTGKRIFGEFGMRYNVWQYHQGSGFGTKDKLAYKHPATFPEKLAEDHILSWSNPGDLVLDPFMGSGTTAKMAIKNMRNWLGFEISEVYCGIIKDRLKG